MSLYDLDSLYFIYKIITIIHGWDIKANQSNVNFVVGQCKICHKIYRISVKYVNKCKKCNAEYRNIQI